MEKGSTDIWLLFPGGDWMLDAKVEELLNHQVNQEFYSAYLYLHFFNYYTEVSLHGFANWFRVQAQEERDHAMLFLGYLQNNNAKVVLEAIAKPADLFDSFEQPLKSGYSHEQQVTGYIHMIYDRAYSLKDFRTMQFLDWFVREQGEEESKAEELVKKFELFGNEAKGLYMLDNELAARVYAPPALTV